MKPTRREFVSQLATITGGIVLLPHVTSCGGAKAPVQNALDEDASIPQEPDDDWDPMTFNRNRGAKGAIPSTYMDAINSPDGDNQHLGKHLPYIPELKSVPSGYAAIMWGDPEVGHARHPNAPKNESNQYQGHWYNWIRIRKATSDAVEELKSSYSGWPAAAANDTGSYAILGDGELTDDSGKNTVYLAKLPSDVKSGDTIRIWAHCLTHGEYVDFLEVP